jgi:hypothetical protein
VDYGNGLRKAEIAALYDFQSVFLFSVIRIQLSDFHVSSPLRNFSSLSHLIFSEEYQLQVAYNGRKYWKKPG